MNSDKILEALESLRVEELKQLGLTEMELINPTKEVLESIEEAGGKIISRNYEVWCHTDNCAHNSHDPGQERVVVGVKDVWKPKKNMISSDTSKLFEDISDECLILLFKCGIGIVGVFVRDHGRHFAESTVLASARYQV